MNRDGRAILLWKPFNSISRVIFLFTIFLFLNDVGKAQTYPASWPAAGNWVTYTQLNGSVNDLSTSGGDASDGGTGVSPNSLDVFNGTSGTLPSVYFFFDSTNEAIFFRLRLAGNPAASGGGGILQNGTYNVLIDTDGDGFKEFFVECNGNDDIIYVYYGNTNQQNITNGATCAVDGQGIVYNVTMTSGNVRLTDSTSTGGGYLLDFQIPLSALKNCSNVQSVTTSTPIALAFSTSATTRNPTQKDYVGQGNFVMSTASAMPVGDVITISGTTFMNPLVGSFSKSCGAGTNSSPVTLTITTLDALGLSGGAVVDTIASVTFSYRQNSSSTWTQIGSPLTSPVTGTINQWTTSWVTSALPVGTYYFKIVVVDDQGHTTTNTDYGVNLVTCNIVSAVGLVSFNATSLNDTEVLLEWETGFEVDNLGFHIYRQRDGIRQLVNKQLIAGSALRGQNLLASGEIYSIIDRYASGDATYYLEDVDLNGTRTTHGPFGLTVSTKSSPQNKVTALSFNEIQLTDGTETTKVFEPRATINKISLQQMKAQSELINQKSLKIRVNREGWYRLTASDLLRAGFEIQGNPKYLQLFVEGQEVPIAVSTNDSGLLSTIEFYGTGIDSAFTNTRSYFLSHGKKSGKRIGLSKDEALPMSSSNFVQQVERQDKSVYFSALLNGDDENFFGAIITTLPLEQIINLPHLDLLAEGVCDVEISLQGVTETEHNVKVEINGLSYPDLLFNRHEKGMARIKIAPSSLNSGLNTIRFTAQGDALDTSLVEFIRVAYPHTYEADNDELKLTVNGGQSIKIHGFTEKEIRVFDVTSPTTVQELACRIEGEQEYSVTATVNQAGKRRLLVVTGSKIASPEEIQHPTNLNLGDRKNEADFIIVTANRLIPAVEQLKAQRETEALKVMVVDVESIYDEFNFGNKSPQAIKDFLAFAKASWQRGPGYVLLVGDATFDPKDYLGKGEADLIPTKLIDTAKMQTSSDDWFSDLNGDEIPDIAIGRLPVRSELEAQIVVRKLIAYRPLDLKPSALLVSDLNDGFDFEGESLHLQQVIQNDFKVDLITRAASSSGDTKAKLLSALNSGPQVVNYVGHGSLSLWRGSLLTIRDMPELKNGNRLSVFFLMSCLNGAFQDVYTDTLAEALLKSDQGGAVAVFASSALTNASEQMDLNKGIFEQLSGFNKKGRPRLGDLVMRAKSQNLNSDVRRSWILFGDPTMRIK
jgi:hypothetical protein